MSTDKQAAAAVGDLEVAAPRQYAGVDVGKRALDVCVDGTGKVKRFDNTAAGIERLIKHVTAAGVDRVVCEASGGYERRLLSLLSQAKVAAHCAQPERIHGHAKALGRRAKTDALDAGLLRDYGLRHQPTPTAPVDKDTTALGQLLLRRAQLVEQRKQETNRLERAEGEVLQDITAHLEHLDERIDKMEQARATLLDQAPALARRVERYAGIRGIGALTAAILAAFMPELGRASHAQIAALAGLAPWVRESGASKKQRHISGGRTYVRKALYMAALSATRCKHSDLGRYYAGLRQRGKPGKVTIVAVMRKLLIMANAVAKRGTPWQEQWTATDAAEARAAVQAKAEAESTAKAESTAQAATLNHKAVPAPATRPSTQRAQAGGKRHGAIVEATRQQPRDNSRGASRTAKAA